MESKQKKAIEIKTNLHPRNKHKFNYDFEALIKNNPELSKFVHINQYGKETIDFFDTEAVKSLNKSLLMYFYGVSNWDVPKGYLCPPIPGRADYIHHVADLLASCNKGIVPTTNKIKVLDIGVGANCVYPIIGNHEYGWSFIGSEIDAISMASAKQNAKFYKPKLNFIEFILQIKSKDVFHGILKRDACIDLTICNPPFHASAEEANKGTQRKIKNLKGKQAVTEEVNFAGQSNELWCKGGEARFVKDMIYESRNFGANCIWFTTLISKESNLKQVYKILQDVKALRVETIDMQHGQKSTRIVAWTFQDEKQMQERIQKKWRLT